MVAPKSTQNVGASGARGYLSVALAVAALYADAWAHNHLVRDVGLWGAFPPRPGPPHFPAGLSLWHAPYLLALGWCGLAWLLRTRGSGEAAAEARRRAAALAVAVAGWLVSTVTSGARTPTAGLVRLESLPGLLGPGALLQAGGLLYLSWRLTAASPGRWARAVGAWTALSTLTYLTQFAHPYVDPWSSAGFLRTGLQTYRYGLFYFGEAMGVLSLLLQAHVVAGVWLAVCRLGGLPPGGWTAVLGANGLVVTSLRDHYPFVLSALLTGAVADVLAARLREPWGREVRLGAGSVAASFCACAFLVVGQMGAVDVLYGTGGGFALPEVSGLGWSVPLWVGTSLLAGGAGWLVAFLADPAR